MPFSLVDFFWHPVLMASTIATLLLSIFCSLFGCLLFVQKKALLAETLSHAAYVGVVAGLYFSGMDFVFGAFSALFGLYLLHLLEKRFCLAQDVALTVTLAVSLSMGALFASIAQLYAPVVYKQSLIFLYGQAATMLNIHVVYFSVISLIAILFFLCRFRQIAWSSFDPIFFQSQSIHFRGLKMFLFVLLSFSVVIGSRACGIMLVSGMMIAPAIFARAFSHSFSAMLCVASLMGVISAFTGTFLSVYIPQALSIEVSMPTGPLILATLALLTALSLLFSPKQGLVLRQIRTLRFQLKIWIENGLKQMHKKETASWPMLIVLWVLRFQRRGKLTDRGVQKAQNLIRIHRLWELYLSKELNVTGARIHQSAEEMEHILDLEMEKRLTAILNDPTHDPHQNEIPKRVD
ncbi:MAG: hypothetical protein EB053_04855 [Chlamydiae bacterium]|nr:hypothetical protein [Chlamydiota bacterium]